MIRFVRIIQSYLVCALPFVVICMGWGSLEPEKEILSNSSILTKIAWETLSWNLMLWFTVLILFLVMLVFHAGTRENTLKRLANLKERDEREQQITGKASRAAFISTLSLLIGLLFFSIFKLNIYRVPATEAINGKTGTVNIGLDFDLFDQPQVIETPAESKSLFNSKDIPLSKSAILLLLIFWQLAIFNLTARKENLQSLGEG